MQLCDRGRPSVQLCDRGRPSVQLCDREVTTQGLSGTVIRVLNSKAPFADHCDNKYDHPAVLYSVQKCICTCR